jgi:hypothetical protein
MRATGFIAFVIFLVLGLVIVDPGVSHPMLSTPFEVMLICTVFPIDPLDRIMTLAEWRVLRRISASTERRLRAAGLGPKITHLTHYLMGVRVRDDLAWMEAGGASGASAQSADPAAVKRKTGRNTGPATAASVARRAERKAAEGTPRRGRPGLTPPPRAEHIEAIEG